MEFRVIFRYIFMHSRVHSKPVLDLGLDGALGGDEVRVTLGVDLHGDAHRLEGVVSDPRHVDHWQTQSN